MTVGEGQSIDWKALHIAAQPTVWYNSSITADAALIPLSISDSIFPSLVKKISKEQWQHLTSNLERPIHGFLAENYALELGGEDFHHNQFTNVSTSHKRSV